MLTPTTPSNRALALAREALPCPIGPAGGCVVEYANLPKSRWCHNCKLHEKVALIIDAAMAEARGDEREKFGVLDDFAKHWCQEVRQCAAVDPDDGSQNWWMFRSEALQVISDFLTLRAENERLRGELAEMLAKHPENSCYDARPQLRESLAAERERCAKALDDLASGLRDTAVDIPRAMYNSGLRGGATAIRNLPPVGEK